MYNMYLPQQKARKDCKDKEYAPTSMEVVVVCFGCDGSLLLFLWNNDRNPTILQDKTQEQSNSRDVDHHNLTTSIFSVSIRG